MSTARAFRTTNQTTPPRGMSLRMLTPDDQYVMKTMEMTKAGAKTDWTTVEAYTQGSMGTGTIIQPAKPLDCFVVTNFDLDHVVSAATAAMNSVTIRNQLLDWVETRTAAMFADIDQHLVMLLNQNNFTSTTTTFSLISNGAHSDIKGCNVLGWYRDLLEHVDPFKGYERYATANWDGDGAEAITAGTLAYARKLMKIMPTSLGAPDVAPAADGTIALEWVPDHHDTLSKLFMDIGPGEEWTAYWRLLDGHFDTVTHGGFHPATTKAILKELFDHLSK